MLYNNEDWAHERCFLRHLEGSRWVIVTPHWDLYDEDASSYEHVGVYGPHGGMPKDPRDLRCKFGRGKLVQFDLTELESRMPSLLRRANEYARDEGFEIEPPCQIQA